MELAFLTSSQVTRTIRAELVKRFPATFMARGTQKIPLKVGINRDIKAAWPEVPSKRLRLALFDYTRGYKYLSNMSPGAMRVNLDGGHAGTVSEIEAADAAAKLIKLRARASNHRKRIIEANHLSSLPSAAE